MNFDIYCDESRPDLLTTKNPLARYMLIGSLWLKTDDRARFKESIHQLRDKHTIGPEFKWRKVTPSKQNFYTELIDWFAAQGDNLRFRCIAVEQKKLNLLQFHENDQELGFYKFYYQLLHHWIHDFNSYAVFCDFKRNRQKDRLKVLARCLKMSNLSSSMSSVQAVRSRESVLTQLADVLTGAAAARLNGTLKAGTAKFNIVECLENVIGRRVQHTWKGEQKFNVFVIDLKGGW